MLLYSGADERGRNGVGIVFSKEMKENVVSVERKNDRIMKAKLCCGGHILNVVSAYAPQIGCSEEDKNKFWREMDEVMTSTEIVERLVIRGDLNEHIGCNRENISRIHGGHGIGEINEEGELIIDFALSFVMAINNTFPNDECVTYNSGRRRTQIGFLLCKRNHLTELKSCKIIKGECQYTAQVCSDRFSDKKR